MSETVATLGVDITASTKGFRDAMSDLQSTTRDAARTVGRIGRRMSTLITVPLVGAGAAAVKAASDVEEMQSKFDTVFSDLAGVADQWARSTAESTNRSRFALQGYLATLQDTFVPMGFARDQAFDLSKGVAQLAVDLASFNNISEDQALNALQSGLVGNTRAVRQFGVDVGEAALNAELLDMGIRGGTGAASEQEKVIARYNILMASTTDAQGDAARTSESFANRLRGLKNRAQELSVEIGQNLMPVADDLLDWTDDALSKWQALEKDTQELIIAVGKWTAIAGPVLVALSSITNAIIGLTTAAKGAVVAIAGKAGLVTALAALAGSAITDAIGLTNISGPAKLAAEDVHSVGQEVEDLISGGKNLDALADVQENVRGAIRDTGEEYRENERAIESLKARQENLSGQAFVQVQEQIQRRKELREELQAGLITLGQYDVQLREIESGWTDVDEASSGAANPDPEGEATQTFADMRQKIEDLRAEMEEMDPSSQSFRIAERRAQRMEDRLDNLTEKAKEVVTEISRVDFQGTGDGLGGDLFETTQRQPEETGVGLQTDEDGSQRFGLSVNTDKQRQDFEEAARQQEEGLERIRTISDQKANAISATLSSGMNEAAAGFLSGIGKMAAGEATLGNVMKSVLDTLLGLAERVGRIAIAVGGAVAGIRKALASLNPIAATVAGAALIAIAGAARSALASAAEGKSGGSSVGGVQSPRQRQQQELVARVQGRDLLFLLREEEVARGR